MSDWPCLVDFVREANSMGKGGGWRKKAWFDSLTARVKGLIYGFGATLDCAEGTPIERLLEDHHLILDFHALPLHCQVFATEMIYMRIVQWQKALRDRERCGC